MGRIPKTLDLIFGVGKYGCLGRGLAHLELEKMLFEMFRPFDFTVFEPLDPASRLT